MKVYKALLTERARDGKLRIEILMLAGEQQEEGVLVDETLVAGDGWHDSEWGAVASLADAVEMLGEDLVDRAARLRSNL